MCHYTHTSPLQVGIRVGTTTGGLHWRHSDDLQLFRRGARPVPSPLVLTLIHGPWPLLWWCKPIHPKCKGSWPTCGYSRRQLRVHAFHLGLSSTTQWPVSVQQFWWHAQTWREACRNKSEEWKGLLFLTSNMTEMQGHDTKLQFNLCSWVYFDAWVQNKILWSCVSIYILYQPIFHRYNMKQPVSVS